MKNKTILLAIFIISIGLWAFLSRSNVIMKLDNKSISDLYGSIHNLSVSLFSLLLAVLALFASLVNHDFLTKMQKTGQFYTLIKSIFWNTFSFFGLICLTFINPFLEIQESIFILKISLIILAISLFLLFDIGKKFWFVFYGLSKKSKK
ncbi:hypothetical protein A7P98_00515 [Eikenella sp. NML080894]|uniref:hypothetical protein n=1 Tax=Eikenella TaxID=538 RepID=UPI0007E0EABD|nr:MULTISPECIES: hypothetical protein [Eikenella]OAM37672.1 hypothetical protein A7P98_00515 [Eikenella sp. NML080894]OAM38449.1 hypothetical protein A7P99_04650 [Eikenella sp. NML120348]